MMAASGVAWNMFFLFFSEHKIKGSSIFLVKRLLFLEDFGILVVVFERKFLLDSKKVFIGFSFPLEKCKSILKKYCSV